MRRGRGRGEKRKRIEEKEWGEGETPLVDVKHEGTANEHNWPSFPSSKETAPQYHSPERGKGGRGREMGERRERGRREEEEEEV